MRARIFLFAGSATVLLAVACLQDRPQVGAADASSGATKSAGKPTSNAGCLGCHTAFAEEKISRVHAKHGTYCATCHGDSTTHARSSSGEIKPDRLFGRTDVPNQCGSCHKSPHRDPAKVANWARQRDGQVLPSGRKVAQGNICTDCHGEHVTKKPTTGPTPNSTDVRHPAISLFNGRDLTGWVAEGKATWKVEKGLLVGTQGPEYAPGDLFTESTFRDFDLTVTYKITWPANSGVWFRYQSPEKAYQGDILEYPKPEAYSGTIYCPGKLFLAVNADKSLVNQDGWNVMRIRAEGTHLQVWLNGIRVADARDSTTDSGRIGFQVHPGKQFGPMKLVVRQIVLEPL